MHLPSSVCIHPWSLFIRLREWKCLVIAPTIPGTPATVSSRIIRLKIQMVIRYRTTLTNIYLVHENYDRYIIFSKFLSIKKPKTSQKINLLSNCYMHNFLEISIHEKLLNAPTNKRFQLTDAQALNDNEGQFWSRYCPAKNTFDKSTSPSSPSVI